ncbi:MAG: HAMP domain-containing histidine kinase [Lachnospiraceae bacterium]|nr:HAMP domain-containing histidine kinase [Lachnospiraceae bacterium]
MIYLYIIIAVLVCIIAVLIYKNIKLRSGIGKISDQLEELVSDNSEKMLDISLTDQKLERLAGLFNKYNDKQRQVVAGAIKDEEFLKDSVANISHDLRTPLTVILGHIQLISKTELTPEQRERLDIVNNKALRMKELVDTFYEYSLVTTSKEEMKHDKLNILNMLIDLISDCAPLMDKKGITPQIDFPEHSVYIYSDRNAVDRIFQNLISNSIKYSFGDISISLVSDDRSVVLSVSNPIPEDSELDPERMFDRFYTGDSSRNSGGTGLGLAVVKELTEKLGGSIKAERNGNKLIMRLELPVGSEK